MTASVGFVSICRRSASPAATFSDRAAAPFTNLKKANVARVLAWPGAHRSGRACHAQKNGCQNC